MAVQTSELLEEEQPPGDEEEGQAPKKIAGRSPFRLAMTRFRRDKLSMISLIIVVLYLLAAISAPFLVKFGVLDTTGFNYDLLGSNVLPKGTLGGISWSHPLGVEPGTGRDVLARVWLGISLSLAIALSATVVTISLGTALGIIAGFTGGFVDATIGRVIDLTLSFPSTLMLLALSTTVVATMGDIGIPQGPNGDFLNALYVVIVLSIFGWPPIARIIRGQVLSIREREFVDAAILMGASKPRIYFKEILPNLWAPLLIYFTLTMPLYISAEAALSYLGVGIKPPTPTLGNVLTYSINYSQADFLFFFIPAFLIALIVVAFNLFGDGMRDALDPKAHR